MPVNPERAAHATRLPHLVWELFANFEIVDDEGYAGSGLSSPMTGTLDLIASLPGSTVADLSRHTPKSQQAISQLVARLEKVGLVERRLGQGRGVQLFLTQEGKQAREQGNAIEAAIDERVRELLGPELEADLKALVLRTLERLERAENSEAS